MVKTGISLDSVKNNNKSQILKILQKKRRNVKEGYCQSDRTHTGGCDHAVQ